MSTSPFARRAVRDRVATVGAAAVLLAGIGVAGGADASAAPTARPTASTVLAALARTAAAQPARPRTGRYDYVEVKAWYWDVTVSRTGHRTGRLVRDHDRQWVAADGSGRVVDAEDGHRSDKRFGPGGLSAPQSYPTNPEALQKVLARSHPAYGTYEWFVAVNDVWLGQVVGPKLQSALLRMLVDKPHLRYRGFVTDPQGRRGVAISTDTFHSGPTRYTLIFDPATGGLLDLEEHPLTRDFRLTKSVEDIADIAWISEGYTTSDRRTP